MVQLLCNLKVLQVDRFKNNFINTVQSSLQISNTPNTNKEVDRAIFRAQKGDEESRNWLLVNFLPLITKISSSKVIHARNPATGKSKSFVFRDTDPEETSDDLLCHLIVRFTELISEYNWHSVFNYWVDLNLKWNAVNYRMKKYRIESREMSLDSNGSTGSSSEDDREESLPLGERLPNTSIMWSNKHTCMDDIQDKEFLQIIDTYAKDNFDESEYEVFRMFFLEEMSIIEIAALNRHTYHSAVSCMVKEIRGKLRDFLSKLEVEYDEYYERYMERESKAAIVVSELETQDLSCSDLMPNIKDMEIDMGNLMRELASAIIPENLINKENEKDENPFAYLMPK